MWAKMGTSLTDGGLVDRLPTARARVTCLLIDLEMVLEISPAIDPVDTGAIGFYALSKREPDGFQQPGGILQVESFAGLEGVDAGSEKGFIRVNVSHSSQKMLIE